MSATTRLLTWLGRFFNTTHPYSRAMGVSCGHHLVQSQLCNTRALTVTIYLYCTMKFFFIFTPQHFFFCKQHFEMHFLAKKMCFGFNFTEIRSAGSSFFRGSFFGIKIPSSSCRYNDSHYKDKMVMVMSYLYKGNSYTWKDVLYIEVYPCCFIKYCACDIMHIHVKYIIYGEKSLHLANTT